ncbi:MAG: NAD(P)/FAD-dependent oxidoreductase [Acidimicrobiales bacterium]|nr:NAD(P)/FAD-dependent oxidoreductase [Acidimicrobiales bacterium]
MTNKNDENIEPVIIGAGPAGLTAAYHLGKHNVKSTVLEADSVVGGISRTEIRDGWRFDIGGHRFFTKVPMVSELWHEILDEGDFLLRPRMSRIFYKGRFYDYPLKATNALKNLGLFESFLCVLSYLWVRIKKPSDISTFEGWTVSRFGWRLYRMFFKTYTEKVWGVDASEIQADWAAQRIKNLSLFKAVLNSIMPKRNQKEITSLIEEFEYPKLGPGMMWEKCHELVSSQGSDVIFDSPVTSIKHSNGNATEVVTKNRDRSETYKSSHIISSMPISKLLLSMDPPAPEEIREAAVSLTFREHITVALVVPENEGFPDNWIYIHSPDVKVGRVQNFGRWSPYLVKDGKTCLGLEYFVTEGDDIWNTPDSDLISLGKSEMKILGLLNPESVEESYVVRMPKAYPMYDKNYFENVEIIKAWLDENAGNIYPVGRNGMHRYNNQDHSMLTAILSVENILGADHDIWSVNVEQDYHEEITKT